jgi:ribosome-associated protein
LRWHAARDALPERVMMRLTTLAGRRMTKEGVLVLTARRHRTRERNREDAMARLLALLAEAAAPPPPIRRPTRPTRGSKQRRLEGKALRGATKKLRGRINPES